MRYIYQYTYKMSSKHTYSHHAAYKNPSEDRATIIETNAGHKIYFVFDGHSGQECVEMVNKYLPKFVKQELDDCETLSPEVISSILTKSFENMEQICEKVLRPWEGGTTATACVVTDTHIVTAHIGDSPCILITRSGEYISSTSDHDTKNNSEKERVRAGGGWFSNQNEFGEERLFNCIAVTRCFGNIRNKENQNGLIAVPEINIWERKPDTYLILCTDSFTEKLCDSLKGNGEKIIANRGTHQEITKEIANLLEYTDYNIETAASLAVHQRTMKFYNWADGIYCGDNTSLILVEL